MDYSRYSGKPRKCLGSASWETFSSLTAFIRAVDGDRRGCLRRHLYKSQRRDEAIIIKRRYLRAGPAKKKNKYELSDRCAGRRCIKLSQQRRQFESNWSFACRQIALNKFPTWTRRAVPGRRILATSSPCRRASSATGSTSSGPNTRRCSRWCSGCNARVEIFSHKVAICILRSALRETWPV